MEDNTMHWRKFFYILASIALLAGLVAGVALADDGEMFRRNVSKTPDQETERANLNHMTFYVPAQSSDWCTARQTVSSTMMLKVAWSIPRLYAKPLVSVYIDALARARGREEACTAS